MGKVIAKSIRGMKLTTKVGLVMSLLCGLLMYEGWLKPLITDSATNSYYFTLDGTSQNLGADGTTNSSSVRGGKISMATGTYNSSRNVTAASNTNWQTMMNVYGPAYGSNQTVTAPAVTIGVRDYNGTSNLIYWKADIYDYNPAGTAGNGILLWSTTGLDEAHPNVASQKVLNFASPAAKDIPVGHRLKLVISARMTSTNSAARLYWGSSTNYSFMRVTEAATAPNSVTVSNLADYTGGSLASVLQGEQNVAMLAFDMYANGATNWTAGKLDKIGSNPNIGDAVFNIYKDSNGNGLFDAGSDAIIGGPYNFTTATGQAYTLSSPQALTSTPQRYFIAYDILGTASLTTTVGARIANSSYFTVSNGLTVGTLAATSSSLPTIYGLGAPLTKTYAADWDSATLLAIPESGGATVTNSTCVTASITEPVGTNLVGLLNFPGHSCASVSGRYHISSEANPRFATLYYNGPGYSSDMNQVKGISFKMRVRGSGRIFTVTLFYVRPDGIRVNAPTSATYSPTNATNVTISLAGQTFINVPNGSRLGVQIGVSGAGAYLGLGSAVDAKLVVEETSGANNGFDVGTGRSIQNFNALASSTDNVVDTFTLTSPTGNQTVNSITITGNANTTSTNVSLAKLYADNGTIGVLDPADVQLASGTFSGNSTTFSGLNQTIGANLRNYLVTYDITGTPTVNTTVTGRVTALAGSATLDGSNDTSFATITILPTTTVNNGSGEPPNVVLPSGGAATNLDAFAIKTNGGSNDTIYSVNVSLAPAGISARIAAVEIVDRGTGAVYGTLTAPTSGDDWRVSTSGLAATVSGVQCYARITPKTNVLTTESVTGLVTSINHMQINNGLEVFDTTSATITLDGQLPTDPILTAVPGTNGGEIQLNWTAASDLVGLNATTPYRVVRGDVNAPVPMDCSSGTVVYQGTALSKLEASLSPGQNYAYRACAIDSVGNMSPGTTATSTARLSMACNVAPTMTINPTSQYVTSGGNASYTIILTNRDTGACGNTTFSFSIAGGENSTAFVTPSTFSPTSLTVAPNGGGGLTTLTVTPKPGAVQGAVNTLTVQVSATGHPSAVSAPLVTTVNDLAPMLHNSLNTGTMRYGEWGGNYTCNTCHARNTSNIKRISNTVATPLGGRPVTFSIVSSIASITSGVFGNDLRPLTKGSQNICEVCHHRTRYHQYSSSKITALTHNNSTDCTGCHPHNAGFRYSGGADCDDCHGDPPTSLGNMAYPATNALGGLALNAGAHGTHNPLMGCYACHNGYVVNPMGNDVIEMGFAINAANYPGFTGSITTGVFTGSDTLNGGYTWQVSSGTTLQTAPNTTTCSVYCHGWPGAGGTVGTPSWVGTTQATCGTCHAATGLIPPTSGSHAKHAATTGVGNGISCAKCHGADRGPLHLDGNVEWDLSGVSPSATYKGLNKGATGAKAPTSPAAYGTCSLVYCHSNVQGATNPALGTGGPISYGTPRWNDVANCGTCHVDMGVSTAATGGHKQHTQLAETSFECRICHNNAGTTTPTNHANGTIDISFSGVAVNSTYSQIVNTPGNGYGTCSNSHCHGNHSITWGPANTALSLCDKCHGSATTAAFYGTAGVGSTTATSDPVVGFHDQHLKSAPYNFATTSDCSACHFKPAGPYSPGHIDTALPAETIFGPLASRGAFFGYTATPTYNRTTRQCSNVWCHGSGMPSNRGNGTYASVVLDGGTLTTPVKPTWNTAMFNGTAANDCTKCHGYPPPAPNAGYTHYGKLPADCNSCHNNVTLDGRGFIDASIHIDGNIDGGCITCHASPPIDTAGLVIPAINALTPGNEGAHNAHLLNPSIGNDCYVCHNAYTSQMPSNTMEMGFRAYGGNMTSGTFYGYSTLTGNVYVSSSAGTVVRRTNDPAKQNTCDNIYCHGGGTNTRAPIGGGTITTPSWEMGYAEVACGACHGISTSRVPTAGSHNKHALAGGTSLGLECYLCHAVEVNNYHVNGNVQWHLNGTDARIGAAARYRNLSSGGTGNLAPSLTFGNCTNLYCHSNAQGAGGSGTPAYASPQWGSGPLACTSCHNDMTASGTGNHLKHKYGCATCHSAAGSGTAKHADRYIDVTFSGVGGGTNYTQSRTVAGSDGYGTCSNIACHYNGSANWGGGSLACVSCHPLATLQANGAHGKHINTAPTFYNLTANRSTVAAYDFGCSNCHPLDVSKHANGLVDVTLNSINTGLGGSVSALRTQNSATADGLAAANGSSGIYGTTKVSVRCSASYCHSNGYTANLKFMVTPDWYGPAFTGDKCAMCHGNSPNANNPVTQPGSPAHYNKTFLGFANVSGGHAVGIHTKSIFNGSVGLSPPGNTPKGSHGNSNTSSTISCNMCHYKTITTSANDKNKVCAPCHTTLAKNPAELIADKRIHVSGTVDVAFNPIRVKSKAQLRTGSVDNAIWSRQAGYKMNGSYDVAFKTFTTATQWNSSTKTCSNIACHNGMSVNWGDTGGATNCISCHTR